MMIMVSSLGRIRTDEEVVVPLEGRRNRRTAVRHDYRPRGPRGQGNCMCDPRLLTPSST